jgi:hypothetical protein
MNINEHTLTGQSLTLSPALRDLQSNAFLLSNGLNTAIQMLPVRFLLIEGAIQNWNKI